MTRTKKVQARYKVSGRTGFRKTTILPALDISGAWFQAAGFQPGQQVNIVCEAGLIMIRPQ